MTEQTAIATLNAPQTLATMNPQGWRLVAAVNGQWTDTPSNAGLTMFFEREVKSVQLQQANGKPRR